MDPTTVYFSICVCLNHVPGDVTDLLIHRVFQTEKTQILLTFLLFKIRKPTLSFNLALQKPLGDVMETTSMFYAVSVFLLTTFGKIFLSNIRLRF